MNIYIWILFTGLRCIELLQPITVKCCEMIKFETNGIQFS